MLVCPHCQTTIRVNCIFAPLHLANAEGNHAVAAYQCPACQGITLDLVLGDHVTSAGAISDVREGFRATREIVRIYPKVSSRPPPPPEVPAAYALDYTEAALILADSPKASAAISRRCLQHVLQSKLNITKRNLAEEIEEAIKELPSHLGDSLDTVRQIGNFAAHPRKSEASGEILEVEPGEAEWSLDVLDALFDYVFVGPAKVKARRDALNAKLKSR